MRKTIYKTLVKTYVTCEERCALRRVVVELETLKNRIDPSDLILYVDGVGISMSDIQYMKELANFVHSEKHVPTVIFGFSAPDDVNVEYIGEE